MKKKHSFLPVFFIFLILSLGIFVLSSTGNFKIIPSVIEKIASPVQGLVYAAFHKLPFVSEDLRIKRLKDDNLALISKLLDQEKLQKENAALLDQFQTTIPKSYNLVPVRIIGSPGFIPGITIPTYFILDKGESDNIKEGLAVVFKDNLVGKIVKVSSHLSKVELIVNKSSSFTAKTENGGLGVIKGDGAAMILDNVLLSENIKTNDTVLTKGDVEDDGKGYIPDLIVGKIQSIDKNPSSIFQKAKIESMLNFSKLSIVFIVTRIE